MKPTTIRNIAGLVLALAGAAGAGDSGGPVADIRAAKLAGVCVQLGCGDATLTAELAQSGNLLVHALEADEKLVAAARQTLRTRGIYGQASVEQWSSPALPYEDNLVNVLVASSPVRVNEKEILRVLAPNGTAWLQSSGREWKTLRKPWPKEFDEWTHWRHGADGNMVSQDTALEAPTGLRWIAGPDQNDGGKRWYYDHLMVSATGRNFYVFDKSIGARDSFNGRLLWSRDIKTPDFKEVSVGGPRTSRVRPVAIGSKLFCIADGALAALDGATGATLQSYGPVQEPREIVFANDILLVSDKTSLRAYGKDGKPLWEHKGDAARTVVDDDHVFLIAGSQVASLELKTGKERWHAEEPKAAQSSGFVSGEGVLVIERATWKDDGTGSGIVVLSASDGKELWSNDYKPGMTHYQEARTFFARGLLWLQLEKSKLIGCEPKSGNQKKELTDAGHHCAAPVATERFFIAPEMEFTDFESGKRTRGRMTRSSCRNPYVPANGLLYTFLLQCECFPMLRGYMALAHMAPPVTQEAARLTKGPAYGKPAGTAASNSGDWPMYRHDSIRSGSTSAAIPAAGLAQLWQIQLATPSNSLLAADWKDNPFVKGPVTQPVAAGGVVLVAVPDAHLVVALDAKTGAQRWSFTAGGRVDTPPSVFEDLCLFGAHDGYVYCVSLADGELAWRFRAAPQETRIMAYGQMESPWPVPGSVLIDGGVAYFAAGRHAASDGGEHAFALKPRTGDIVWEKAVTDTGVKAFYGGLRPNSKVKVGVDYEPMDIFVKDGDRVAMSRWRFDPAKGDVTLELGGIAYEASPGFAVPRGLWSYGIRQTKMVQDRPPTVFASGKIHTGEKGDVALLLAGETLIAAKADGNVTVGTHACKLAAPAIHDGMIAAYGCVYVVTADGKVACLATKTP